MKSQNLAIGFTIVVQQIMKTASSEADANKRLYKSGQEMGLRMCDEFNMRQCSEISPSVTIKLLLQKLVLNALGLSIELTDQKIRLQKRNHFYNLTYKQSGLAKSILSLCEDIDDQFKTLQPCYLVAGFIYGALRTLNFYGQVTLNKVENQRDKTQYIVDVKKDIKQED